MLSRDGLSLRVGVAKLWMLSGLNVLEAPSTSGRTLNPRADGLEYFRFGTPACSSARDVRTISSSPANVIFVLSGYEDARVGDDMGDV